MPRGESEADGLQTGPTCLKSGSTELHWRFHSARDARRSPGGPLRPSVSSAALVACLPGLPPCVALASVDRTAASEGLC